MGRFLTAAFFSSISIEPLFAQTREEKVLGDKKKFESMGLWFYNDLDGAFEAAKESNKPVLVVLRCIPCEECVKLDDDLLETDIKLQQLLKSFIRVRVVGTNGLDLSMFEFDTDQSFAVFLFNADKTLYGRYGTRSNRTEWESDVSVDGLYKALEGALKLHQKYPDNREVLLGKQAEKPLFATPEKIPALASKYTGKLDYQGAVVKSCIHCHQIGDATREYYRAEQGKLTEKWLYPFPHPKTIGLILDPRECATVLSLVEGSEAAKAGLQIGDQMTTLNGQAILSFADVQWVLHQIPDSGGTIKATVRRGSQDLNVDCVLSAGWRTREDIAWRASSWTLRRIGLGGMVLTPISDDERKSLDLADGKMALKVGHVGAFAPHDRAKKAGVLKGDILVEYDGRSDLVRETDLLAYSLNSVKPGHSVPMKFVRGSEERRVEITTAK
ncbi:MAG: Trx7/PDZ domain-containing (seleno)protein [Planctomycetota bacterium]|nr:Trx7/PDZ domain-containing (seleno)protein [Planctomycetota bacterium]